MNKLKQEYVNCKKQFYLKNKFNFIMTLIFQVVSAIFNISIALFILLLIESMETKNVDKFKEALVVMVAIIIGFTSSSLFLKFFKNLYMHKALSQLKHYVFNKILNKSIGEFNNASTGKYISAFSNDLNSIELNYLNGNIMIFNYVFMLVVTFIALFRINVIIAFSAFVACIIPISVAFIFGNKLINKEKATSEENASFVDQIKDLLNGFIVIKSFKAEKEVLDLFTEQNFTLEETKRGKREATDMMLMSGQISAFLVICIIFILGIYFTFKGTMTIATVVACVQLSNYILDPIKQLVPLVTSKNAAVALIKKLAVAIEESEETNTSAVLEGLSKGIEMKDVSLKYDDGKIALNNINIDFKKGKKYAIVGPSGCGKSTLLKLLLGHFNDYEGEIKYDDNNLRDISLDSLYDVVSVIQQNVFLFDKSLIDNITMFKDFDYKKVRKAVDLAGLSKLVNEKGNDYSCGEGGRNLSGGEKQRISIARCLIRETPVLLMDEATAALDNATAFQVENEILSMDHLTSIIVTHRLEKNLLEKYDEIIVLNTGKIVENGTFNKLMSNKQYFYSLYNVSKVGIS
ncbi:MAG: ABC transporter ATP-binding protein [Lachnospiraceae bacterium]|nr:ABC transporter ATP-binding protein [Lachnospiraceae bacterium]